MYSEGNIDDEFLALCLFKEQPLLTLGGGTQLSSAWDKMTYFRHWGPWDSDTHPHVLGQGTAMTEVEFQFGLRGLYSVELSGTPRLPFLTPFPGMLPGAF